MSEDMQSRRAENPKVPLMDTAVPMQLMGGGVKKNSGESTLVGKTLGLLIGACMEHGLIPMFL